MPKQTVRKEEGVLQQSEETPGCVKVAEIYEMHEPSDGSLKEGTDPATEKLHTIDKT